MNSSVALPDCLRTLYGRNESTTPQTLGYLMQLQHQRMKARREEENYPTPEANSTQRITEGTSPSSHQYDETISHVNGEERGRAGDIIHKRLTPEVEYRMDSNLYTGEANIEEEDWPKFLELQEVKYTPYGQFDQYQFQDSLDIMQSYHHKNKVSNQHLLPQVSHRSPQLHQDDNQRLYSSITDMLSTPRNVCRSSSVQGWQLTSIHTPSGSDSNYLLDPAISNDIAALTGSLADSGLPKLRYQDIAQVTDHVNEDITVNVTCSNNISLFSSQPSLVQRPSVITNALQTNHSRQMAGELNGIGRKETNCGDRLSEQQQQRHRQMQSFPMERYVEDNRQQQQLVKLENPEKFSATTSTGKTRTKDKYRTVYTELQKAELERQYITNTYISAQRKADISRLVNLSERQVKIWFQNRRAKERKYKNKQRNMSHGQMREAQGRFIVGQGSLGAQTSLLSNGSIALRPGLGFNPQNPNTAGETCPDLMGRYLGSDMYS